MAGGDFVRDPSGNGRQTVTVLVPVYNEEETVEQIFSRFNSAFPSSDFVLRFLIVDDGSTDGTLANLLRTKGSLNNYLRVVVLSRNFGRHAAVFAGLERISKTDYVIIGDADLQNSPSDALRLLGYLSEEGLDLVYGIRKGDYNPGLFSKFFWVVINLLSLRKIPKNQTSMLVFNEKFLELLKRLSWKPSFFPAALSAVDARVGFFEIETHQRAVGYSKYGLKKKLRLFLGSVFAVLFRLNNRPEIKVADVYE